MHLMPERNHAASESIVQLRDPYDACTSNKPRQGSCRSLSSLAQTPAWMPPLRPLLANSVLRFGGKDFGLAPGDSGLQTPLRGAACCPRIVRHAASS